jgi:hypothetical protein
MRLAVIHPARYATGALLLLTFIAVFVPLWPEMPSSGLDPAWRFSMNQAVAQGLAFGSQVIFTFGPYAAIFTRTFHPATDALMLYGSLGLALCYGLALLRLMRGAHWGWALAFGTVHAALPLPRDTLFFASALLACLAIFSLAQTPAAERERQPWRENALAALYSAPFGLLPLVKGTLLILCLAMLLLSCACCFANGRRRLAAACLATPAATMLLCWLASGQHLASLGNYFYTLLPIISGYTDAMALPGNAREIWLYLASAAAMLATIGAQSQLPRQARLFLLAAYFVFLFLAFKASFVRHDSHAVTASLSLLLAALLLPFFCGGRMLAAALAFAVLGWYYIDAYHIRSSADAVIGNVRHTYGSAWQGLRQRMGGTDWPRQDYLAAMNDMRAQTALPKLPGTVDIYSFGQSWLFSSGNTWSPRPIFQSYSVYTPALAAANRQHLLGQAAPDHIFFRVEPIDSRMPSSEDGLSWPALLHRYQLAGTAGEALVLGKRADATALPPPQAQQAGRHRFGERVVLPASAKLLYASLDIQPSLAGRLASILFKSGELEIRLTLADRSSRKYRLIAGMARSSFLLSPLIEGTKDFAGLYGPEPGLAGKQVTAIEVISEDGMAWLWQGDYALILTD